MISVIAIIGLIFGLKEIISEKTEKRIENASFNWEQYWRDVGHMTAEQQTKKISKGGYITSSSNTSYNYFNDEKYNHDKNLYGETITEIWKECGVYNRRNF